MGKRPLSMDMLLRKGVSLIAGFLLEVAFILFALVFLVMGFTAVILLIWTAVG